jgi:hypothetical protein
MEREARQLGPRPTVSPRVLELEIAKRILEEIFYARLSDVVEMIQRSRRRRAVTRRTGR